MTDSICKALAYFYMISVNGINDGKIKGLKLKALFTFINQIKQLSFAIEDGKVTDFDDVVGGYFNERS